MPVNLVTPTRTWYSYANVPFTPATSTDVQQWMLWLWKELLIGNYTGKGGTEGPEGPRPATSFWTVVRSSDGAGNTGFSDLWVSRTNVIRAAAGSNHSWIVLKSPITGPNGALGFGQGPMWMCIDNVGTGDSRARIIYSRNDFSAGGTATARPTSTTEFEGAMYEPATVPNGPSIWTDTNYNIVRRVSIAVDANGQFFFYQARNGAGIFESVSCCVQNINSDDRDLYRQWASTCFFGHPQATGQRTWTGGQRPFFQGGAVAQDHSSSGGLVQWRFGCKYAGAMTDAGINGHSVFLGTGYTVNNNGPYAGHNPDGFGYVSADIDSYLIALPLYVLDYGAGWYNNLAQDMTQNKPQWRGQVPDAWFIPFTAVNGSSYPSAAAQTHVVAGSPGQASRTSGGKMLTPMSVQVIL